MRKLKNPLARTTLLPRMSWAPENLFALHQRSFGPLAQQTNFTKTSKTLFQQTWMAKKLARAYHGDWIPETRFTRHLLPVSLPPISSDGKQRVPLASLMFAVLESRLDVLVFRACFAPSVYAARDLVTANKVKVDGMIINNPNVRLKPGQVFQVEPKAIIMLRPPLPPSKYLQALAGQAKAEEPPSEAEEAFVAEATTPAESASVPTPPVESPVTTAASNKGNLPFHLPDYASPFLFIPAYLEVSFATCSAVYVREPTARPGYSEIPTPYDADGDIMKLTWEWYNRVGRRRKPRAHKSRPKVDTSHIVTDVKSMRGVRP